MADVRQPVRGVNGYWLFIADDDLRTLGAALGELPYKHAAGVVARLTAQTQQADVTAEEQRAQDERDIQPR